MIILIYIKNFFSNIMENCKLHFYRSINILIFSFYLYLIFFILSFFLNLIFVILYNSLGKYICLIKYTFNLSVSNRAKKNAKELSESIIPEEIQKPISTILIFMIETFCYVVSFFKHTLFLINYFDRKKEDDKHIFNSKAIDIIDLTDNNKKIFFTSIGKFNPHLILLTIILNNLLFILEIDNIQTHLLFVIASSIFNSNMDYFYAKVICSDKLLKPGYSETYEHRWMDNMLLFSKTQSTFLKNIFGTLTFMLSFSFICFYIPELLKNSRVYEIVNISKHILKKPISGKKLSFNLFDRKQIKYIEQLYLKKHRMFFLDSQKKNNSNLSYFFQHYFFHYAINYFLSQLLLKKQITKTIFYHTLPFMGKGTVYKDDCFSALQLPIFFNEIFSICNSTIIYSINKYSKDLVFYTVNKTIYKNKEYIFINN